MNHQELVNCSMNAKQKAYSPYYKFPVGAAVLTAKGIMEGTNIENVSASLTMCAERTAIFSAYMQGCRKGDFLAISITADTLEPIVPCGACLQVMIEFFEPDTAIVLSNKEGKFKVYKFSDILPMTFTKLD